MPAQMPTEVEEERNAEAP